MSGQLKRWLAFALYGAFALGVAFAVCLVLRPSVPLGVSSVPVEPARGRLVREYVDWKAGEPTAVEFMDFECPPCRMAWPRLRAFLQANPAAKYRPVNFPLSMHRGAFPAAVAYEAAKTTGAGEAFFDTFIALGSDLGKDRLNAYLCKVGASSILGTSQALPFERKVRQDMAFGARIKVEATPTLFMIARDGAVSEVRSPDALETLLR